jgi:hypothetical protein
VLSRGSTDDRIAQLEERMQRLQESMDVLRASIDEFRDDLVHTLRNLPDRLPPVPHIHSLPLDPTDPDFGERLNAVPREVMVRLRAEVARQAECAATVAAEGEPTPGPVFNGAPANEPRRGERQGRLFG